jgi:GxxExxY protein
MNINDLSGQIVNAAMNVHRELGPGLLESVYQACLVMELEAQGLNAQS